MRDNRIDWAEGMTMQTMMETTTVEVRKDPLRTALPGNQQARTVAAASPPEVATVRIPPAVKARASRHETPTWRQTLFLWALALALMALSACGGDPVGPGDIPTFRVEVSGEVFVVQISDADMVTAFEARLAAGTPGVINGSILAGDGGFNSPWSWHMDPATVAVADFAIEVCDGRPSMVEADLDYWLNTLGQFCPWGATVVERVE